MASAHTQGAKLRTPKGFNKLLAVNLGFGVDQHGQDATVSTDNMLIWFICALLTANGFMQEAAVRAVKHAMESTALPGVLSMVPGVVLL